MMITREELLKIGYLIKKIRENNAACNINLKYKILKLEGFLKEEFEITNMLLQDLSFKYAETNEAGEPVIENGAIKIIAEKALQLQAELNEFCKTNIQVPEYYFTLDELDTLSLDWNEIEAFMPFIK